MSPRTAAPAWRWGNIPIPQAHLAGLGTGILLQVVRPWRLPWPAGIGQSAGWPLILAGLWLGAWAVRAAAGTAWPLLLLPVVLVLTQVAVMREERFLERSFGATYRSFKASVRRYR